jgi:hypothetical protein
MIMKKLALLSALLATTTLFSFAAGDAKDKGDLHRDASVVHESVPATEHKPRVRTPEQFAKKKERVLKKLGDQIAKTREIVKAATVSAEIRAEAEMKIQCAQNWYDAIKEYKDVATHFRRSTNYANAELKSAITSIKTPLKASKLDDAAMNKMIEKVQVKHDAAHSAKLDEATMNKMVADLGAPIKEVVQLSEKIKVYEENDTCFKKILETADAYIKLATLYKDKVHFKQIIKRAKRLIKDAHKFLEDHKVDPKHRASKSGIATNALATTSASPAKIEAPVKVDAPAASVSAPAAPVASALGAVK